MKPDSSSTIIHSGNHLGQHDCKKCVRGNDCPFRKLEQLPVRTQSIPQQAR
jgi:hypothetical protein